MKTIELQSLENVRPGEYLADAHDGFDLCKELQNMSTTSFDVPFKWGLAKLQEIRPTYTNKMVMCIAKDESSILLGYNYDFRVTLISIVFR